MNPNKVQRNHVTQLTDLPNVGPAIAQDLRLLGISTPGLLINRCPFELYKALCKKTGKRHDPCVIDVFMSITRFMNGGEPLPWWKFTEERKRLMKGDR